MNTYDKTAVRTAESQDQVYGDHIPRYLLIESQSGGEVTIVADDVMYESDKLMMRIVDIAELDPSFSYRSLSRSEFPAYLNQQDPNSTQFSTISEFRRHDFWISAEAKLISELGIMISLVDPLPQLVAYEKRLKRNQRQGQG